MFRPALLLSLTVVVGAALAACSSSGGKPPADGGGTLDGYSFDYRFGDLPPGCPPAAGNEKHVGDPCTKDGSECSGGLICACKMFNGLIPPEGTPCFCTIPILGKTCDNPDIPAGICGTGATCCSYKQLGSICVPDICIDSMCPMF